MKEIIYCDVYFDFANPNGINLNSQCFLCHKIEIKNGELILWRQANVPENERSYLYQVAHFNPTQWIYYVPREYGQEDMSTVAEPVKDFSATISS